ncbi:MAG: PAS domain S-box protein [Dehalococcoidia bacterium]|nr:PAS domain S-box protein [Dehalococcoidia bacterium]
MNKGFLDHSGKVSGAVTARNVTEQRLADDAIRESESMLRSIAESTADAIITTDLNGNVVFWNGAAERMFGYGNAEIVGSPLVLLIPESRRETFSGGMQEVGLKAGPSFFGRAFERQGLRKDGSIFPVEVSVSASNGGKERFFTAVVRDITDRKRAEEDLRHSKEFMEAVFDSVTDGICVIDATDFRIISANKVFLSTYDQGGGDIIGSKCHEVTHHSSEPCAPPGDACPLVKTLLTGAVATAEHVHVDRQGRLVYVEVSTSPLKSQDGKVLQVVHTTHDITERKRNDEEARRHWQRLSALRDIESLVTSNLDLQVTLNVLVEQVVAHLGSDAAAVVLLFDSRTQRLEYAAGRGFSGEALRYTSLRLGEGHAGKAALDRCIQIVPNLSQDPGDFARAPHLAEELFVAYFAAPLVAKGEIKGVLEIFSRSTLEPDPEWLGFLELLAGQAAIFIDNASLFEDARRSNLELSAAYDATLEGWVRALDLRHKETEGHTRRVTEKAVMLARALGLGEAEVADLRRGALLHDIGKLGIPDSILLKAGSLTEEEWRVMRRHPVYAYQFLAPIEFFRRATLIPYCHHEKWDGTGYPRGLKAEEIPLGARIFAVVDVWDALRSDRPYRFAWPEEEVREYIKVRSGTDFDPKVVDAFLGLLESEAAEPVASPA